MSVQGKHVPADIPRDQVHQYSHSPRFLVSQVAGSRGRWSHSISSDSYRYLLHCSIVSYGFGLRRTFKKDINVHVISAGHSEKAGLEALEALHQIGAISIWSVVICWGEQADQIEIDRALSRVEFNDECIIRIGRGGLGMELELVLHPLILLAFGLDVHACPDLGSNSRLQLHGELAIVGSQRPKTAGVGLRLDANPPPAGIFQANHSAWKAARPWCHIDRRRKSRGERNRRVLEGQFGIANRLPWRQRGGEFAAALERAILDQLCVNTTVTRVIDVLEHNAVHERRGSISAVAGNREIDGMADARKEGKELEKTAAQHGDGSSETINTR